MENNQLITLVKSYYNLPKGYIINNPDRLNFICKIFDICDVYISNKALKHIVESRKEKDLKNVDEIISIIRYINIVLIDPDIVFNNDRRVDSIGVSREVLGDELFNRLIILEYIHKYNHYELITMYERYNSKIKKMINIKHLIL